MKIVHILPGSGDTFYCQNCMRDNVLALSLRKLGHRVIIVPMYLPLSFEEDKLEDESPVFFGAINLYLKERIPVYRKAPVWMERILDSPFLLRMAAHFAGSTRAAGLEEMTLSMLRGEDGNQASELDHLIAWLANEAKPDVVHLSNSLLLGLAHRIRAELDIPVVCSLQDENQWIDPMPEEYQELAWHIMAEKAVHVDAFISVSEYYAERMVQRLGIPREKMNMVFLGIDLTGYEKPLAPADPPAIGFLSRLCECRGLGILADAFIDLKKKSVFRDLKLHITGGKTADDNDFLHVLQKRLKKHNVWNDVRFFPEFDFTHRLAFLQSLSVLSVPVPDGEAFGAYQLEALACGVPVVQPNVGAFPEIMRETGGGILYEPNNAKILAANLEIILNDRQKAGQLAKVGREIVFRKFDIDTMARSIADIYEKLKR